MSRLIKGSLLATASAIVLAAAPIAPAAAFDSVNWTWDAEVLETVTKLVNVNIDMTPTGMLMVEDLQVFIGDAKAVSTVSGVENNQPEGGGVVDLGTQEIQFHYGLGGDLLEDEFKSPSVTAGSVDPGEHRRHEDDQEPNINGTVTATIDLGEVDVPLTESFDALTELPSVVSAATAVANNTSITSDTSIELHEGQFVFNVDEGSLSDVRGVNSDNSNLEAAAVLGVLALTGNLESSDIKATSTVSDILNASVDSSATAVANSLSVSLTPATPADSLVIADIVQFAFADVTAKSDVTEVSLNSYTNLGSLTSPIVSSVATAVGNNKTITVVAPVVAAPVL
jgi:hypothetical protein